MGLEDSGRAARGRSGSDVAGEWKAPPRAPAGAVSGKKASCARPPCSTESRRQRAGAHHSTGSWAWAGAGSTHPAASLCFTDSSYLPGWYMGSSEVPDLGSKSPRRSPGGSRAPKPGTWACFFCFCFCFLLSALQPPLPTRLFPPHLGSLQKCYLWSFRRGS